MEVAKARTLRDMVLEKAIDPPAFEKSNESRGKQAWMSRSRGREVVSGWGEEGGCRCWRRRL